MAAKQASGALWGDPLLPPAHQLEPPKGAIALGAREWERGVLGRTILPGLKFQGNSSTRLGK